MESSVPESLSLTIIGGTSATLSRTVSLTSLQRSKALGTGTVGGFTLSYTLNGVSNVGTPVQGHITIPVTVHGGLPSSLTVRGVSVTIPPSPYYVGDVISNPTITVQATGSGVMQGHVLVDGSLSWSSTPSFTVSISGSAFVTSGSGYEEYSFSGTATLRLPSLGGAELEPESREARNGMVASLINRGAQYFTERNEQAAEDHFLRALALDPASVPALRNLGILKLQRDDLEKAAAYLEKARSLAPQDAQVQSLFVRLREEEGNSAALMRELQRFVSLQPRNPEAWAKLGILYEQHEDRRQAEQAFIEAERQQTVEPYPYYWLARERKDANLAHLAAGKAVQKAGLLRLQAAQAIEQKEGELGERELNLLKELSVKIGEPLTVLGDTLALLEELHPDPDAFREDLVLLNEWYPHSVELKEALAGFHQGLDQWSDALSIWETVLHEYPTSVTAQTGRAKALEMLGRSEQAALAYRRALELDPLNEQLYESLFRVYRASGREDELLGLLEELSLRDRRNPVLLGRLAELADRRGLYEQAGAYRRRRAELEVGDSYDD